MWRCSTTYHPDPLVGRIRRAWRTSRVGAMAGAMLVVWGCSEPATKPPAAGPRPVPKAGPLRGTTQQVLDLETALEAGARVVDAAPPSQGIEAVSGAAVSSAAMIGMLAVAQKMQLFEAEHGRKPATHAEFMQRIIEPGEPGAVSLPALPRGKAYAFDPRQKTVVILALPERDSQAP